MANLLDTLLPGDSFSATIATGEYVDMILPRKGATAISVNPASTATIELAVRDELLAWEHGTISAQTQDVIEDLVNRVKVTAVGDAAVLELNR